MPNPITVKHVLKSRWHCEAFELHDSRVNLTATVTKTGGRLISLLIAGQELIVSRPDLFLQATDLCEKEDRSQVSWSDVNLGGEVTWLAPQSSWGIGQVPYLMLNLGSYDITALSDGVKLWSRVCPETGLQIYRRILLGKNGPGSITIEAQFTNLSDEQRVFSPWSVLPLIPAQVEVLQVKEGPIVFGKEEKDRIPERLRLPNKPGNIAFNLTLRAANFKAGFIPQPTGGLFKVTFPKTPSSQTITLWEKFSNPFGCYPHAYGSRAELYYDPAYFELEVLEPLESFQSRQQSHMLKVELSLEVG